MATKVLQVVYKVLPDSLECLIPKALALISFSPVLPSTRNPYFLRKMHAVISATFVTVTANASTTKVDVVSFGTSVVLPATYNKEHGNIKADAGKGPTLPQCCHCGWRGDHAPGCSFSIAEDSS